MIFELISAGNAEAAKELIENNADVNAKADDSREAIHVAALNGKRYFWNINKFFF